MVSFQTYITHQIRRKDLSCNGDVAGVVAEVDSDHRHFASISDSLVVLRSLKGDLYEVH